MSIQPQFLTHFQQHQADFIGASLPWLADLRQQNLAQFLQQGIPTRRQEHWKYTNFNFLEKNAFVCSPTPSSETIAQASQLLASKETAQFAPIFSAYRIVFVNGHFCPQLSFENLSTKDILPLSLALAATSCEKISSQLQKQSINNAHFSTRMNLAFMSDGLFLHLPKNTVLDKPVHLLFLTVEEQGTSSISHPMSHPRNIILLEENSCVVILEEHLGVGTAAYYKNAVTQITLAQGAQLDFYKLQREDGHGFHQALTQVDLGKDSQFSHHNVSLGGRFARDDLNVSLNAPGAFCRLNGLAVLRGEQHVDHHTRIDHHSPCTASEEYYKGVLSGQATGVFNGKVIVHTNAQKVKSSLINKNLLLSEGAEINTKPELEIYADDVQCSHGATVGQIDQAALFYLRSRGIESALAVQMLVQAFIEEIIDRMQDVDVRGYVQNLLKSTMI